MSSRQEDDRSRLRGAPVDLDYEKTKAFFEHRGEKANPACPLTATMYQDNNFSLVVARDAHEKELIIPFLQFGGRQKVLDIGCGLGRWARPLCDLGAVYQGIDFSDSLIEKAQSINCDLTEASFCKMSATKIDESKLVNGPPYDRLLISGLLIYLNDADCRALSECLLKMCGEVCRIYLREPVSVLGERLTLNNYYSDELKHSYSAIYRTEQEVFELFLDKFIESGFSVEKSGEMYPALSNRVETLQKYFIVSRES